MVLAARDELVVPGVADGLAAPVAAVLPVGRSVFPAERSAEPAEPAAAVDAGFTADWPEDWPVVLRASCSEGPGY